MVESRAMTVDDGSGREVAPSADSSSGLIAMVLQAARDPMVDATKMVTLADLATRLQDREREAQFNRDKIAAIMEMPSITKRGEIKIPANRDKGTPERIQGRYAKFEDMHRAVMPILQSHNLVLTFNVDHQGQMVSVQPILSHANGFVERGGTMVLPIDTSGSKNATQGAGSAASYGKRHQMKAVLNIIEDGEDIDGLGSLPDDQLNDRQERLLAEGEATAARGPEPYREWYGKLAPRDRAWLVVTGRHAEWGGEAAALPPEWADRKGAPAKDAAPTKAKATPEQLTERYIRGLAGCENLAALADYQATATKFLSQLRTAHPDLHARCIEANSKRYSELSAAPAGGSPISANESAGSAEADSLFGGEE